MEKRRAEKQCERAREPFIHGEIKKSQQAVTDQDGKNADENICGEADDDVADVRIGVVVIVEDRELRDVSAGDIGWKQQERLADAVPREELAVSPVNSELGIFIGEDGRLGCPERVSSLKPVCCVARSKLARLHDERGEKRREAQKKNWIGEQTPDTAWGRIHGCLHTAILCGASISIQVQFRN